MFIRWYAEVPSILVNTGSVWGSQVPNSQLKELGHVARCGDALVPCQCEKNLSSPVCVACRSDVCLEEIYIGP